MLFFQLPTMHPKKRWVRTNSPEVGRSLLSHLPDIIFEVVRDESHSPLPSTSNSPLPSSSQLPLPLTLNSPIPSTSNSPLPSRPGAGKGKSRGRKQPGTLIPPGCRLTRKEIVEYPLDQFEERMSASNFSKSEADNFRSLRRRGKNSVMLKYIFLKNDLI